MKWGEAPKRTVVGCASEGYAPDECCGGAKGFTKVLFYDLIQTSLLEGISSLKKIGKLISTVCVVVMLFFLSSSGYSADISKQGGYALPKTPDIPTLTLTPTSYPRFQSLIESSVRSLNPISLLNENKIVGQLSIPTCRKLYVKVTAYSCYVLPKYCETFTSTRPKWGTVAVDPEIIGFSSMIYIPYYGVGIAEDTGAWIEGNHIDIWFPTEKKALEWGVKWLEITVCKPSP